MSDIVFLAAPDEKPMLDFMKHQARLAGLKVWSREDIIPGSSAGEVIHDEIQSAKVVVVLGSVDLFNENISYKAKFNDAIASAHAAGKPIHYVPARASARTIPTSAHYEVKNDKPLMELGKAPRETAMINFITSLAAEVKQMPEPVYTAPTPPPHQPAPPRAHAADARTYNPSSAGSYTSSPARPSNPSSSPGFTPRAAAPPSPSPRADFAENLPVPRPSTPMSGGFAASVPRASSPSQTPPPLTHTAAETPTGPKLVHMITLGEKDRTAKIATKFNTHSFPAQHNGEIIFTHSHSPGMDREKEKDTIAKADFVLVAVTPESVASPPFMELAQQARNEKKPITVVVCSDTNLEGTFLHNYATMPFTGSVPQNGAKLDTAMVDMVKSLRTALGIPDKGAARNW